MNIQIARLIKNGHDRKQQAIIYGISISTIYRYHPVGDIQTEETIEKTKEKENR
ncbi:helix-turn-helix domain-containing protein [Escherichia coli]|nr:helix-turn-helix domain-containing protein [Escherichia coli]EEY9726142.1 helix-turn-helix domain-containing protein [Escherichia coli]EFG5124381.1 helix-turn-helix domain-containing protein [Escherichia coli]EFJ8816129.1 helix-turn-helix domain-containing protein [Escherichia coli]EFM6800312.1 helix-turn-helix domain-containing protein [Escherichia coli]